MADERNIIEIIDLKKYFKEVKAVDGVSFNVRRGELFAFLGLNGAGKSTTINILCGILGKDSGKIYVDGLDCDDARERIKSKFGVVFQNTVLDSRLTVLENLKSRAALYGINKKNSDSRIEELSEKLEFTDILKRPFCKLSGGQKRRVDIARALIHSPEILILDEPTTGLDPRTRIIVWKLLAELRKDKNLTIILTTHYMEEADEADNIVIIDGGKIIATGTPLDLKKKYALDSLKIHSYTPTLKDRLEKDGVKYDLKKTMIEINPKSSEETKRLIEKYGDDILDFEVIKGNMDNVFVNITGKELKETI